MTNMFKKSPGMLRQVENYPWTWEFEVTNVKEGHDCVSSKDRSEASKDGAKLTFGEVLDSGVNAVFDEMEAHKGSSFHDLGMGPGKMLMQVFLSYPNLDSCVGVELAQGRYWLAERNLALLASSVWRGRKFRMVEHMPSEFMRVVEVPVEQHPERGFEYGDSVIAFDRHRRKDARHFPDYSAKVIAQEPGGSYTVQYRTGERRENVDPAMVFRAGSVRSIEIWFGNLFDYPGAFDADIVTLETDFPEKTRPALMDGIRSMRPGTRFLTYHDLRKWVGFNHDEFKQLDVNVYDNSRYITSWSQGWRFYLWARRRSPLKASVLSRDDFAELLSERRISVRDKHGDFQWAEVLEVDIASGEVLVSHPRESRREYIGFDENRIRLSRPAFEIGEKITCYWPNFVEKRTRSAFELYNGTISGHQADGSYIIEYEDGDRHHSVHPHWVFKKPNLLFREGDHVLACWPQYAQNKNSPERYRKFAAVIVNVNPDSTYSVKYDNGDTASRVREMWIDPVPPRRSAQTVRRGMFKAQSSLNESQAVEWSPRCVAVWLTEVSFWRVAREAIEMGMRGSMLLQTTNVRELQDRFNISRSMANRLADRIDGLRRLAPLSTSRPASKSNSPVRRRRKPVSRSEDMSSAQKRQRSKSPKARVIRRSKLLLSPASSLTPPRPYRGSESPRWGLAVHREPVPHKVPAVSHDGSSLSPVSRASRRLIRSPSRRLASQSDTSAGTPDQKRRRGGSLRRALSPLDLLLHRNSR